MFISVSGGSRFMLLLNCLCLIFAVYKIYFVLLQLWLDALFCLLLLVFLFFGLYCGREKARAHTHTRANTYLCARAHMLKCVCVCVCVFFHLMTLFMAFYGSTPVIVIGNVHSVWKYIRNCNYKSTYILNIASWIVYRSKYTRKTKYKHKWNDREPNELNLKEESKIQ